MTTFSSSPPHSFFLYSSLLWQALLQRTADAACVEYEKLHNGSEHGWRLKTCPLDKPSSYVYCCVETCCEEPHIAILVTSVLAAFLISFIGIGLVVLCIIDLHKVTCHSKGSLESPLLTEEEEEQETNENSKISQYWQTSEISNIPPAPVEIYENSSTRTLPCDLETSRQSTTTCVTDVTAIPVTPVEEINIISNC